MLRKNLIQKAVRFSTWRAPRNLTSLPYSHKFSTLTTQDIRSQEIIKQALDRNDLDRDQQKFNEFCDKLYKIYELEETRKENVHKRDVELLVTSYTSKIPLRDTMKIFGKYQISFDDEHLASIFEHIAKLYHVFRNKSSYYLDFSRNDLAEGWRFVDLIDDIRYLLLKGVEANPNNLIKIAESLARVGYQDPELQAAFLQKLERLINDKDHGFEINTDDLHKNPQYHKKGYYPKEGEQRANLKDLLNNPEFSRFISKIITQEAEKKTTAATGAEEKAVEEIERLLGKLTKSIEHNEVAQSKLGQAILAVRDQFNVLNETQREKFLAENIFLRSELLELEEFLLEAGLLNLKDVTDPQNIQDPKLKMENAAKILQNLLIEQKEIILDPTISQYTEALRKLESQKETKTVTYEDLAARFSPKELSKCLAALTDLANEVDGLKIDKTPVNDKWKELLPNIKLNDVEVEDSYGRVSFETYRVPPHYTKTWQSTMEYLRTNMALLLDRMDKEQPSADTLEARINLAYSYSRLHLSRPTKGFLAGFSQLQKYLNDVSTQSFIRLLKTLNYVSKVDGKLYSEPICAYVNTYIDDFSPIEALNIAHAFAVHGLHETNEFDSLLRIVNTMEYDNTSTEMPDSEREMLYDLHIFFTSLYPEGTNKNPSKDLSSHLHFVAKTQRANKDMNSPTNVIVDPVKDLVSKTLKNATIDKFTNLLPVALSNVTQEYLPTTFVRSQDGKVGITVGGGEIVSVDENEVSSLQRFRFSVLERLCPDVSYRAVNYNHFLDINYAEGRVTFRSGDYLEKLLEEIYSQNKAVVALRELSLGLLDHFGSLPAETEDGPNPVLSRFNIFFEHLQRFFVTNKEYNAVLESEQRNNYADKVKFRLANLHGAFVSAGTEVQNRINTLSKQLYNKDFYTLLQDIKNSLNTRSSANTNKNTPEWFGVLYGEELLTEGTGRKDIDKELLNYPFLWDTDYASYKHWREILERNLNGNNLNFETEVKVTNNFHSEKRVPTGLIPQGTGVRNSIRPHSFPWNWEIFSYSMPKDFFRKMILSEIDNFSSQKALNAEVNAIVNLQNLKIEWRANLDDSQLANKLVELDFIEELIDEHLGTRTYRGVEETFRLLCPRDAKDYVFYLEKLSRAWLLKDHYANYFFNQGFKDVQARELKKEYEEKQDRFFEQYKQEKITEDQYNNALKHLRGEYLDNLKGLTHDEFAKDELIPDVRKNTVQYDFKSLIKQNDLMNLYNYKEDPDYLRTNKDLDRMLELKRRKAETKLIKLRLIKKLHEGIKLSGKETEYLRRWRESLKTASPIDMDLTMVPKTFTSRNVGTLSKADVENFSQLNFVDINALKQLGLTDLVLELSHFYDESAITRLETLVKGKELSKEWGISPDFKFDTSENKEVRLVLDSVEEYVWRKAGEYSQEEREGIHEMFGLLRGYTTLDKQWLAVDRQSLDEFIDLVNPYDNRNKFLEEWFEKKENEIKVRTKRNVPANLMKSDNAFREENKKKLENECRTNLETVFNKSYDQISQRDLHIFVENIIQRLYLLKKYFPNRLNYILKGALTHPNIVLLDKNNLQTALKAQHVKLNFGSSDFVSLDEVELEGDRLPENDFLSISEIKNKLSKAKAPYLSELCQAFQSV